MGGEESLMVIHPPDDSSISKIQPAEVKYKEVDKKKGVSKQQPQFRQLSHSLPEDGYSAYGNSWVNGPDLFTQGGSVLFGGLQEGEDWISCSKHLTKSVPLGISHQVCAWTLFQKSGHLEERQSPSFWECSVTQWNKNYRKGILPSGLSC